MAMGYGCGLLVSMRHYYGHGLRLSFAMVFASLKMGFENWILMYILFLVAGESVVSKPANQVEKAAPGNPAAASGRATCPRAGAA